MDDNLDLAEENVVLGDEIAEDEIAESNAAPYTVVFYAGTTKVGEDTGIAEGGKPTAPAADVITPYEGTDTIFDGWYARKTGGTVEIAPFDFTTDTIDSAYAAAHVTKDGTNDVIVMETHFVDAVTYKLFLSQGDCTTGKTPWKTIKRATGDSGAQVAKTTIQATDTDYAADPTRDGYTLEGWYRQKDFSTTTKFDFGDSTAGTKTNKANAADTTYTNLIANWTATAAKVQFYVSNVLISDPAKGVAAGPTLKESTPFTGLKYGEAIPYPVVDMSSYSNIGVFKGWVDSTGAAFHFATKLKSTASGKLGTATIAAGDMEDDPDYYTINANPVKIYAAFDTTHTVSLKVNDATLLNAPLSKTAIIVKDNAIIRTKKASSTEVVTLDVPELNIKTGYKLTGWFTDAGTEYVDSTPVTADFTLTAKIEPIKRTLHFVTDAQTSTVADMEVVYNTKYTMPTATKAGYTLEGWYRTYDGTTYSDKIDFSLKLTDPYASRRYAQLTVPAL